MSQKEDETTKAKKEEQFRKEAEKAAKQFKMYPVASPSQLSKKKGRR